MPCKSQTVQRHSRARDEEVEPVRRKFVRDFLSVSTGPSRPNISIANNSRLLSEFGSGPFFEAQGG